MKFNKMLTAVLVSSLFATTAQAQSTVTIYGIVDGGITNTTTDTTSTAGVTTSVKDKTTGNGGAYTSQRLGFRGTEDLGGGLKAGFVYEFGLSDTDGTATDVDSGTDAAGNMTTRIATVGLSGSFGSLDIGRQTTIADKAWGIGDVGSANNFIGRAYTSFGKLNNSRSDRLINYTSPNFAGFTVQAAFGERSNEATTVTTADSVKETGLGIAYSAGSLNAMIGYSKEDKTLDGARLAGATTGSNPEQLVFGANYDFKVAKAFVTYAQGKDRNASSEIINDKKVTELGVAVPFGKTTVQASYFDGENKPTATTKQDLSGYQVAALYAFSKRTTGYVVYGASQTETQGSLAKTDVEQFGFGIRHAF
jgi:predicted porin